jgi:hypothetical protein
MGHLISSSIRVALEQCATIMHESARAILRFWLAFAKSSRRESFQASWVPKIINSAMRPNPSRMHLNYAHSL